MNTSARRARASIITVALAGALILSSCAPAAPATRPPASSPDPVASLQLSPPTEATESESEPDDGSLQAAFQERDEFFIEQRLPRDGSPLVAVTEAQKKLVTAQQEWVESQGGTWGARDEWILLALGSDTCENGILNQHRIDAQTLLTVVARSPLVQQLIPADATEQLRVQYVRNLASISVFAAGYLCPADSEAWQAAFAEAFPE